MYQAGAKSDQILQAYKTIEKHNQNNLLALLYQADLYIRLQNNALAKEYIKKALAIAQEPKLRTKLLFQQALLLYQEQTWAEMHQALLEAQQLQPDFAPVLNLLAYYYATKTNDLEKAQALIEKALQLDPYNTHFLDTKAVVWYKQKHYTKAYELLVALEKQEPQDMHIKYHKAKVAYNLNNVTVAKETLNQVIALTSNEKEKAHYKARLARWNKK